SPAPVRMTPRTAASSRASSKAVRKSFQVGALSAFSTEGAEPGDRLAYDQVLHLIRAFIGIERLGIREEARNAVVGEDAVAAQQLSRPGARLTRLGRRERLRLSAP